MRQQVHMLINNRKELGANGFVFYISTPQVRSSFSPKNDQIRQNIIQIQIQNYNTGDWDV